MTIQRRTIPAGLAGGSIGDSAPAEWLETAFLRPYAGLLAQSEWAREVDRFLASPEAILVGTVSAGLLGGALLYTRRARATGRLSLRLEYPAEIEGELDVQLMRRAARARSSTPRPKRRLSRSGVRRETQIDGVAPGPWLLVIEGRLLAAQSRACVATIEEELEIEIDADGTTRIDHGLPPVETPVEIRVHWDRQPARDVGVSLAGRPESLRYAGQGVVATTLPPGTHALLVGAGDRVVEEQVTISGYEPCVHTIDIASAQGLIFKGCPPAVSAFLRGDLGHAARALERDGQSEVAAILLARLHQEQGQPERAAERLESVGRTREAAELRRSMSEFDRAASLFEDAGELFQAAEMYEAAQDWSAAARTFSTLEDWEGAARCYEASGDIDGLVAALEGQGEIFRAAALASEHDDRARAIRLLQQVGPKDPEFSRAGELLALAFEQEGHFDLAANQLERCLAALRPGEFAPALEIHLSELFEECGEIGRALEVIEKLRDRDPTHPGVARRMEALRKKRADVRSRDSQATPFVPPAGATAFVADDRYEILEEIGRGGMGLVYRAKDRRLGRIVALKRMPDSLRDHPTALNLFLTEAQAAARMNHPNIVTLYDADQENGRFFITMELLEGLPLSAILEERGPFGPRDTARLGQQVCAGLAFAHTEGIVHRDIKTTNLFITRDRVLKIMDFGLAKIIEAVRDGGSTVIAGTPDYMAPEQTAGAVADGRTDLYSLGVTLFELSTGCLPFSEGDVAEKHRSAPRPDPSKDRPGYPAALARLIMDLMAPAPEDRPDRAEQVAERLGEIIATDEPSA